MAEVVTYRTPSQICYATVSFIKFFDGVEQIVLEQKINNETKKVVLDSITYELGDNGLQLRCMAVRGFRKDKKVKARSELFHRRSIYFDDLMSQVPDSFHEPARTYFNYHLEKLSKELLETRDKGIQIK